MGGGNQRGGWGDKAGEEGKVQPAEESKGATDAPEEEEKKAPRREPEPVEEEEEVGFTLDDYMAQKQANSKGLLAQKTNLRDREKIQDKVATKEGDKQRIQTIDKNLSWRDNHAMTAVA